MTQESFLRVCSEASYTKDRERKGALPVKDSWSSRQNGNGNTVERLVKALQLRAAAVTAATCS